MAGEKRVLVLGLDSAPPKLVFDQWLDDLPNIKRLIQGGIHGQMRSSDPPITVPAWMSMMTSKDAGELGIYGFRNRSNYTYDGLSIANANSIKESTVWDLLGQRGKKSVLIGVPPSYPPKPINGAVVGCFLTPSTKSAYTFPAAVKGDIERLVGDRYLVDVENFRSDNRDDTLRQIYQMTESRFIVARDFIVNKPWQYFMMVEMGTDRLHHAFWKYHDKTHPKYEAGNKYESVTHDYYRYLDGEIGSLLALLDDRTIVLVVSDHGAKKMEGGICVNEWLIREGYLKLQEAPKEVTPFAKAKIDWTKTIAWSEGGYYARLFMNVKGREPQGVIDPKDYERVREEIGAKLAAIPDESNQPIGTKVIKPEQLYRACRRIAPDLIVYFGDLNWRSVGSIGLDSIYTYENDIGPDDANHDYHGIFVMNDPQNSSRGQREGLQLMDVAPTILQKLQVDVPKDMRGKIID